MTDEAKPITPTEGRCCTCTYWTDVVEGTPWGTCGGIPDEGRTAEDNISQGRTAENASVGGNDGWESWLSCRSDFGCVNWKANYT